MQDKDAHVGEGLRADLPTMTRRKMLVVAGGVGALAATGGAYVYGTADPADAACLAEVESEMAGPYPADGSNGPDVRVRSGIVRSDLRSSFGTSTNRAAGVPLQFSLTVQDLSCAPVVGAAVYAWHCDRAGLYSLYSPGVTNENYLRGIQVTNASGVVTFTSVYPGCYPQRWPHIHFEVYGSLADATGGAGPIRKTSQIALPEAVSRAVYSGAAGYAGSLTNLREISLATDLVFRDDLAAREMATVTGSVPAGYTAALTVAVDPTGVEGGTRGSA